MVPKKMSRPSQMKAKLLMKPMMSISVLIQKLE